MLQASGGLLPPCQKKYEKSRPKIFCCLWHRFTLKSICFAHFCQKMCNFSSRIHMIRGDQHVSCLETVQKLSPDRLSGITFSLFRCDKIMLYFRKCKFQNVRNVKFSANHTSSISVGLQLRVSQPIMFKHFF